jgi:hypothetical protein
MRELDPQIRKYVEEHHWPVLPLEWRRTLETFKRPLTDNGSHDATRDLKLIEEWFLREWPAALVGIRTGAAPAGSGICVLDVDIKPATKGKPAKQGDETMKRLGFGDPPRTPMVITGSGGRHLYFQSPHLGFPNTQGAAGRGIGKDLDWRGNGGYIGAPGGLTRYYRWHTKCNLDTCLLLPVPPELLPREPPPEPEPDANRRAAQRIHHADPYVHAMMERACRDIAGAPDGEQNFVLNGTAFNIGRTAARLGLAVGPLILALVETTAVRFRLGSIGAPVEPD